ncbi:MAG: DUF5009 domain-containing protein [Rhodanobacter sp.]
MYWPLEHASWNGCTPTDLIFPIFLFVVAVSVALAILPRLERGDVAAALARAAMWRAVRLVLLGLAINALAAWLLTGRDMRIPGVLQRIGVCFAAVALFAIHTRPRTQWSVIVLCCRANGACLNLEARWSVDQHRQPHGHRTVRTLRVVDRCGQRSRARPGRQRRWPALGRRFGVHAIAAYAGSEVMQIVLPGAGASRLVSQLVRRLDDPALRSVRAVAGVCRAVRRVLVVHRVDDGSTPHLPQALTTANL